MGMTFKHLKTVTVFGYADCHKGDPLYDQAVEVSRVLAEAGLEIVNGGGPGVMMAATDGAHQGGGNATVATFYPKFMENFEGKYHQNKADKEVIMNNYVDRTMKLLELGDAYVIFNGGTGTLSEFGMAWGLAYLYFGHHKPLILYGDFWFEIVEVLAKNMKIADRPKSLEVYKIATTPEQVVQYLSELDEHLASEPHHLEAEDSLGEKAFIEN